MKKKDAHKSTGTFLPPTKFQDRFSHIIKPSLALFITATIIIALLGFVHGITEEPIALNKYRIQQEAMREVLPLADSFTEVEAELSGHIVQIYRGTLVNDETVGYVVSLSPEGYSGNIDMLVGIDTVENIVSGMRVIRHTETPGLGSLATSPNFYRKFDNKALMPLVVVKVAEKDNEIDSITSSTITTKAITDAVNEAIMWVNGNVLY